MFHNWLPLEKVQTKIYSGMKEGDLRRGTLKAIVNNKEKAIKYRTTMIEFVTIVYIIW